MRFVCEKTPGNPLMITQALNPITGSAICVSPAFTWETPDQLDMFLANFELLCRMTHHFGQPEPAEVNPATWPSHQSQMAAFRSSLDSFIP